MSQKLYLLNGWQIEKIRRFVMVRKNMILGLVLFLFLLSPSLYAEKVEWIPGEFVVKLHKGAHLNSIQLLMDSKIKKVIAEDTVVIQRSVIENTATILSMGAKNSAIKYIEPNYIYRINKVPDDTDFNRLWGMQNTGQKDSTGTTGVPGIDIGAVEAWDITTGSKKVVVAVIDTGVSPNIADLKQNIWTNETELNGQNGVDDDKNGYVDDIHGYDFVNNDGDPTDDHGHGSHCSGTIGASGNNGQGVAGVTWEVSIMGVKFLSASGSGSLEGAIQSIDYARKNGAHILSNSWGGGGYSDILKEAIEKTNEAGQLFVAAAGNESNNNDSKPSYPASYDVANVLSVAAIDNRGQLASFSNYGAKKVHVGAPGVNVYSTTPSGFASWSGTSMACPHVSGVAALLLSHQSDLSGVELKERIVKTTTPLAALKNKVASGGLVNALHALNNETAPEDPNDPDNWKSAPIRIETSHPYREKEKLEWVVEQAGAEKIAVHFSRFDTERGYDKVEFFDSNNNSLGVMSGLNDGAYSPFAVGEKIIIRFSSDDNVQKHGFEIDKVAFQ